MTIFDALHGPLPADVESPFLALLADPDFGLVHLEGDFLEEARMVQGLFAFHRATLTDMMLGYLCEADGNDLPDVVKWCEAIGAERAASLASMLLALYPADLRRDEMERCEFMMNLADEQGPVVERLLADRWDEVLEIPDRLHRYVVVNLTRFELALAEGRARGS
jgi:hypothetical protein